MTYYDYTPCGIYDIIAPETASDSLRTPQIFNTQNGKIDAASVSKLDVQQCKLVYGNECAQGYDIVQPFYRITGSAYNKDGESDTFTLLIPAFDEPKEEVGEIDFLDVIMNSFNYTSGHVTVITGVEWNSASNCFIFCVFDPSPIGSGTKHYVTYDELRATCTKSEPTYSNWEIWYPTVVVKTEYSDKNIFDEITEFESPNY